MNTTHTRRDHFAFKLSAAKYHMKQIQKIFRENKTLFESDRIDEPETRPFLYHYYALVYEIYSCFDMTLHYINSKFDITSNPSKVLWKDDPTKFQKDLQLKSPDVYNYVEVTFQSEWFKALKTTRNHLLHHGFIDIQIDYDEEVNVINPVIENKNYQFDTSLWAEEISNLFNRIYT